MKNTAKKIELVDKNIAPSMIAGTIKEIVKGCFDAEGEYRNYMKDYSIMAYSLALFTNYDGETDFDAVMEIYFKKTLDMLILDDNSNGTVVEKYYYLKDSVEDEIKRMLDVNSKLSKFVDEATKFIGYLNVASEVTSNEAVKEFMKKMDAAKAQEQAK